MQTGPHFLCVLFTHHIVGDGRKQEDGDDAVGDEISEDLGQEVDRCAIISTRVLVTTTGTNTGCHDPNKKTQDCKRYHWF